MPLGPPASLVLLMQLAFPQGLRSWRGWMPSPREDTQGSWRGREPSLRVGIQAPSVAPAGEECLAPPCLRSQHDGQPYCHKPCYGILFGPKGECVVRGHEGPC